jgi:DNA (cytosine-5)-methyltransferase 1
MSTDDIGDRRTVANESIDVAPTLISKMGTGGNNVPVVLENHPQDSRVTIAEDGIVPTLTARMGTGGGNVPMIMDNKVIPVADKATRNKGGGGTRNDDGAGNGLGVAYAIDRAAFNQGANAQYNISIQEEVAQTLVARGPGGVAHPQDRTDALCYAMQAFGQYKEKESEIASAIKARDFKDNTDLVVEPEYIIRRLTPLECCRLQGFPDDWTQELGIAEPTEDDILYWRMVFREQAEALGETKKEKTDNQIRKWLQNPSSDSAVYKMWGNGIALPNAMFVMEGIAEILQEKNNHEE